MRFRHFIRNVQAGVVIGFVSESDMLRYLDDPLTGSGWRVMDEFAARDYMQSEGLVWDYPTSFYGGNLDGMEVMFSMPDEMRRIA